MTWKHRTQVNFACHATITSDKNAGKWPDARMIPRILGPSLDRNSGTDPGTSMVTSQHCRKVPSTPVTPIALAKLWGVGEAAVLGVQHG